jgi:hypothetical protein
LNTCSASWKPQTGESPVRVILQKRKRDSGCPSKLVLVAPDLLAFGGLEDIRPCVIRKLPRLNVGQRMMENEIVLPFSLRHLLTYSPFIKMDKIAFAFLDP